MIELWALVIAGLGLFFAGMELLSGNLRGLTSRRFQRAVGGWTETPLKGLLWGAMAGALTQSSAVVTFIVVGLLVARIITVARGLPVIVGGNLGACGLLFVVSLDVGPAVLLMVGVVGIGVAIDRLKQWRAVLWALFGIALLFVGLDFLKQGTAPLAETALVRDVLQSTTGSYLLAFVVGAVLTVIVNSSIAIGVLSMSLMASGVFTFETTAMVVYATNFGSSATTYLLSMKLRGEARQLAMYQVGFNIVGCLIFVPLFVVETATGLPLSLALLEGVADPELRIALAYLLFNGSAAVVLLLCPGPTARLMARIWPRTAAEDAARPTYIGDFALNDPDLALELAAREQHRAYGIVAGLLDPLVEESEQGRTTPDSTAPRELLAGIAGFLEDLGHQTLTPRQYEHYYGQLDVQGHLEALTGDVDRFAATVTELESNAHSRTLGRLLAESLHAVMHSCAEALSPDGDADERALAVELTADRGPTLRSVREAYVSDRAAAEEAELATTMLGGISLFERIIWRLNAIAQRRSETAGDPTEAGR